MVVTTYVRTHGGFFVSATKYETQCCDHMFHPQSFYSVHALTRGRLFKATSWVLMLYELSRYAFHVILRHDSTFALLLLFNSVFAL